MNITIIERKYQFVDRIIKLRWKHMIDNVRMAAASIGSTMRVNATVRQLLNVLESQTAAGKRISGGMKTIY